MGYREVNETVAGDDLVRVAVSEGRGSQGWVKVSTLLGLGITGLDLEQAIHPSSVFVREDNSVWVLLDDNGVRIKPGQLGGALNEGAKIALYDVAVLQISHGDQSTALRVVLGAPSADNPALVPVTGGGLKLQSGTSSTYVPVDVSALRVSGTKVVGAQGAAVADAIDAPSVILRLNELLARCRAHGLIAT